AHIRHRDGLARAWYSAPAPARALDGGHPRTPVALGRVGLLLAALRHDQLGGGLRRAALRIAGRAAARSRLARAAARPAWQRKEPDRIVAGRRRRVPLSGTGAAFRPALGRRGD